VWGGIAVSRTILDDANGVEDPATELATVSPRIDAGVWIRPRIGIGFEWSGGSDFYRVSVSRGLFGSDILQNAENQPWAATARFNVLAKRAMLDAVTGIGVFHLTASRIYTGNDPRFPPITTGFDVHRPAIILGVDCRLKVAPHLEAGPSLRLYYLNRTNEVRFFDAVQDSTRILLGVLVRTYL